ncbi:MAG: hypothetical protein M1831_002861 [Alyxoria varia]|nr:MAG: hypothetical protein M1831_002861 [Alyxoria varia]
MDNFQTTPGDSTPYTTEIDPQAAAVMAQLQRRRKLAATVVPTDDTTVRSTLRSHGEPMTLFAEGPSERRDRLKALVMAQREAAGGEDGLDTDMADVEMGEGAAGAEGARDEEQEEFYTEASAALQEARREMTRYSLRRARKRIVYQKQLMQIPLKTHVKHRNAIKERLKGFDLFGSQTAERPVSMTRFAPDGQTVAAADWGGTVKLLDVPALETKRVYKGHSDRIRGLDWYPGATVHGSGVSAGSLNFASAGAEGNIQLWPLSSGEDSDDSSSTNPQPLSTITAHASGVRKIAFDPSGRYLASASDDETWRLFDIQHHTARSPSNKTATSSFSSEPTELLLSESHSRPTHAVAFSPDGSLLCTGGADSIGRVWDLRTGHTIMILEGHMKDIHAMDWAPDGYRVVSGSADGLAIVWDVRAVRESARVPANARGVTDIRWYTGSDGVIAAQEGRDPMGDGSDGGGGSGGNGRRRNKDTTDPTPPHSDTEEPDTRPPDPSDPDTTNSSLSLPPPKSGTFLISSGFDRNISIFSADDWARCRSLGGHAGHALSCDVDLRGRWIVSGGYDRTVKIWGCDDGEGV